MMATSIDAAYRLYIRSSRHQNRDAFGCGQPWLVSWIGTPHEQQFADQRTDNSLPDMERELSTVSGSLRGDDVRVLHVESIEDAIGKLRVTMFDLNCAVERSHNSVRRLQQNDS